MSLPESAKRESDSQLRHLDHSIRVLLSPADCYSLRCVMAVGACPHLSVKIPVQTSLAELREMLADKWHCASSRIELRMQNKGDSGGAHGRDPTPANPDHNPDKIRIQNWQKFKNGRVAVHYSRHQADKNATAAGSSSSSPSSTVLSNSSENASTSILSILLLDPTTTQPENVRLCYRFIRDRPVCEPVSLLAKCASIFTEVIYDVDKRGDSSKNGDTSDIDQMLRQSILASREQFDEVAARNGPRGGARKVLPNPSGRLVGKLNGPGKSSNKATNSVAPDLVEMHLQQLNGLNRPNRQVNRQSSPAYTGSDHLTPDNSLTRIVKSPALSAPSLTPTHSSNHEQEGLRTKEPHSYSVEPLFEPAADSNSSISHILRSVLNESEVEAQLAHLLNENSIDYERLTNFSDLLNDTDDDL